MTRKRKHYNYDVQAVLALRTVEERLYTFVQGQFKRLHAKWVRTIQQKGPPCNSCKTRDVVPFPSLYRLHNASNCKPKTCQSCNFFAKKIRMLHRTRTPNWKHSDASFWSTDASEIAKCYIPSFRKMRTYFASNNSDCLSLLYIMQNCTHFQDFLSFNVFSDENPLNQAIEIVARVQNDIGVKINKEQRDLLFSRLRRLLNDRKHLYHLPANKRALRELDKIRKLDLSIIFASGQIQPMQTRKRTLKGMNHLKKRRTIDSINELSGTEELSMFYTECNTETFQAYEFCCRRIQMALTNFDICDESLSNHVHSGQIEVFASSSEYIDSLSKQRNCFNRKPLSCATRAVGSPVIILVSSYDFDTVECIYKHRAEKEDTVCVVVVEDTQCNDTISDVETRKWGFIRRCMDTTDISTAVDDLFERYIFKFYESRLRDFLERKDINERKKNNNIKEAILLFKRFKIEVPVWLNAIGDDTDFRKKLILYFSLAMQKFRDLSYVFDCVPESDRMLIKLLEKGSDAEKEKNIEMVKRISEGCKIPEEKYRIAFVTVTKYADYKYKSGDKVQVNDRKGTLSGFANMNDSNSDNLVAIFSNHVAEEPNPESKTFSTTFKMQKDNVGEILLRSKGDLKADVAVAKIDPCKHSDCDKKFRDEQEKRLYAVPLTETELDDSMYERVHFWGAKTKPGIGQIQELGVLHEGGSNHIYIKEYIQDASKKEKNGGKKDSGEMEFKEKHSFESTRTLQANCSENGNKWQKGDSGAMVLKEKHRSESTRTLQAVGMFMGETFEKAEGRKYIATPLHLGLAVLSENHNATFSLFGEHSEDHENSP